MNLIQIWYKLVFPQHSQSAAVNDHSPTITITVGTRLLTVICIRSCKVYFSYSLTIFLWFWQKYFLSSVSIFLLSCKKYFFGFSSVYFSDLQLTVICIRPTTTTMINKALHSTFCIALYYNTSVCQRWSIWRYILDCNCIALYLIRRKAMINMALYLPFPPTSCTIRGYAQGNVYWEWLYNCPFWQWQWHWPLVTLPNLLFQVSRGTWLPLSHTSAIWGHWHQMLHSCYFC